MAKHRAAPSFAWIATPLVKQNWFHEIR